MQVDKVVPCGYCKGVIMALRKAQETLAAHPADKVYILGMVVHNSHVVEALRRLGAVTLDDKIHTRRQWLDSIDDGIVIFTAHGTDPALMRMASEKGLTVVDATCPDVEKNMRLIASRLADGYEVIYLGVKDHPESLAVSALGPGIHLVTGPSDIDNLDIGSDHIMITNQTTMSLIEISGWIASLKQRFPMAEVCQEICPATRLRQQAVMALKGYDALIVVGDPASNNTAKLASCGQAAGIPLVVTVENAAQLPAVPGLDACGKVAVTAGASTPGCLTDAVIAYLRTGDPHWFTIGYDHMLDGTL